MFTGWYELLTRRFRGNKEFVSLDAKRFSGSGPQPTFELLKIGQPMVTDPEAAYVSPTRNYKEQEAADYFSDDDDTPSTRQWRKPAMSFSGPRAPSYAAHRMDWEQPLSDDSRGGLGLHPPQSPSPYPDGYGHEPEPGFI